MGGEGDAQRRRHADPLADLPRLGVEAAEAALGRLDRRGVGGTKLGAPPTAQEGRRPRVGGGHKAQPGSRARVGQARAEGVSRRRQDRHRRRRSEAVNVDDGGRTDGGGVSDEAAQAVRAFGPRHPRHVKRGKCWWCRATARRSRRPRQRRHRGG